MPAGDDPYRNNLSLHGRDLRVDDTFRRYPRDLQVFVKETGNIAADCWRVIRFESVSNRGAVLDGSMKGEKMDYDRHN
jgi:hypothetical protein